jgi:hypothetical protein
MHDDISCQDSLLSVAASHSADYYAENPLIYMTHSTLSHSTISFPEQEENVRPDPICRNCSSVGIRQFDKDVSHWKHYWTKLTGKSATSLDGNGSVLHHNELQITKLSNRKHQLHHPIPVSKQQSSLSELFEWRSRETVSCY